MNRVDVLQLDLNLLKVFKALEEHRSATQAGLALGLSQSTISHALTRLRTVLGDPLFVRGSRGVQPTEVGLALAGPIADALKLIQGALERQQTFDPANSSRTFRLLMTDMGEALFGPALMQRVRTIAPHVRLIVEQRPRDRYAHALEVGDADLAIGQLPSGQPDLIQQQLSRVPFLGFAGLGHPILAEPTLEQFFAAKHLAIGSPAVAEVHLRRALGRSAGRRHVAMEVRHYLSAGPVLASTDLIAVLPDTVLAIFSSSTGIGSFVPPLDVQPVTMHQFWHARSSSDAGCRWLRKQIDELFRIP